MGWYEQFPVLARIERRGLHFDEVACQEAYTRASKEIEKHEEYLKSWVHDFERIQAKPFKWDSVPQRQAFFYDYLGFEIPKWCGSERVVKFNRERKRTTDELSLRNFAKQEPRCDEFIERLLLRQAATKTRQFLRALPNHRSVSTGRIHTSLSPSTETGRLASKNPNLQNIPSNRDKFGIRRCFSAPCGSRLVVLDYSQLELYVLAHFLLDWYGDSSLYDDLRTGDIYTTTALRCWNDASRRPEGKAVTLSVNYLKTAAGLGGQLKCSTAEAQDILDAYYTAYPGVQNFQRDCIIKAREKGYCTTLTGRKRWLQFRRAETDLENLQKLEKADRQAVNTVIQGTAADIVASAMVESAHLPCVLQVHDELIFECPEDEAHDVLAAATAAMVAPGIKLAVQLKVSGGIFENWSEAK